MSKHSQPVPFELPEDHNTSRSKDVIDITVSKSSATPSIYTESILLDLPAASTSIYIINDKSSKLSDTNPNKSYSDNSLDNQDTNNDSNFQDDYNDDNSNDYDDNDNSNSFDNEDLVVDDNDNVKDRQEAINKVHLFGLPIWKPALYKKSRTVTKAVFVALHSRPKSFKNLISNPGNIFWLLFFGWWMFILFFVLSTILMLIPYGGLEYSRVLFQLSFYIIWPFGRVVERIKLLKVSAALSDDHASSSTNLTDFRSISFNDLVSHNNNNDQSTSIIMPQSSVSSTLPTSTAEKIKIRKGGIIGRTIFYLMFLTIINPILLFISGTMWLLIITIPMGSLTFKLSRYLWRDPLSLYFKVGLDSSNDLPTSNVQSQSFLFRIFNSRFFGNFSNSDDSFSYSAINTSDTSNSDSLLDSSNNDPETIDTVIHKSPTVLLCTNEAVGLYYFKYTYDGVNIIFINLMVIALFVLILAFVIGPLTNHSFFLTKPQALFPLCLFSTIPLAYFIGQAVSSISAQSSLGLGAVINATFGSIIEVILYSLALTQGKSEIVEGALIGSFLAGMLLMPGISMIAGGIKFKEQKFNAKSAGVTATLIIMSIIAAFAPTLFYHTYGKMEMTCEISSSVSKNSLINSSTTSIGKCVQLPLRPSEDPFYLITVRPFSYFCAVILLTSYIIGLWFTLRTHVKHIYSNPEPDANAGMWLAIKKFVLLQNQQNSRNSNNYHKSTNNIIKVKNNGKLSRHSSHRRENYSDESDHSYHSKPCSSNNKQSNLENKKNKLYENQDVRKRNSSHHRSHKSHSQSRISDVSNSESFVSHSRRSGYASSGISVSKHVSRSKAHQKYKRGIPADDHNGLSKSKSKASEQKNLKFIDLPKIQAADSDDQFSDNDIFDFGLKSKGSDDENEKVGGHDAPNWSITKSAIILCVCTLMFSLIAEVLVDTVDIVVSGFGIREKILGLTLFALVPTVTEFVNASAFAMQKNIELAIEICNAYTVQVSLLQIPVLLMFSAYFNRKIDSNLIDTINKSVSKSSNSDIYGYFRPTQIINSIFSKLGFSGSQVGTYNSILVDNQIDKIISDASIKLGKEPYHYMFTLIFARWEMIAAIFSVFLLTYTLIEGKSNYFKGSILCLGYLVWIIGFIYSPEEFV
ncbi:Low affinity vacuolar monovalent cation/H(+) antiporter [Smittium culicis]|uniref:Low affinity vacuolar monovalent cation/H(+) antiporter n=1 Tax=Smittium culicis TaxID=133412 RepID=A0A1R1YB36_9FUNG|nr:Low affinity vacuolar monovalent cation/H(+) antiporter [Smittium culicis]